MIRFVPLYRLYLLYKEEGLEGKADSMARVINEKPVKVPSYQIGLFQSCLHCFLLVFYF